MPFLTAEEATVTINLPTNFLLYAEISSERTRWGGERKFRVQLPPSRFKVVLNAAESFYTQVLLLQRLNNSWQCGGYFLFVPASL